MSAQPANTDIKVYPTLRSYRDGKRNESVAALIKRLRPLVMSIPAHEVLVGALTRDTSAKDFSPYMGEARSNFARGFPIVVGLLDQVSYENAQTNITNVDFGFQIGQDKFLRNVAAGLTRDLHKDARALSLDVDEGNS